MTPENERTLRTRYPLVYGRPFMNDEPFRCDDGWFDILDRLGAELQPIIAAMPEDQREGSAACQVKEKFGGLRVYQWAADDACDGPISLAEAESFRTCEVCGKPGTMQTIRFVKTVCDEHYRALVDKYKRG